MKWVYIEFFKEGWRRVHTLMPVNGLAVVAGNKPTAMEQPDDDEG